MKLEAREKLLPSLRHHVQITLLGGLLVLAPLVFLVHTLIQLRKTLEQAVVPLKQTLPGANSH